MFKNYFNMALRGFLKQKTFSIISVLSLVVGITSFILLMLYVQYELSYDTFHKNSSRIYLVAQTLSDWKFNGSNDFALTSGALAPALKQEFKEVESAARVFGTNSPVIYGINSVLGEGYYADNDFFNIFTFPIIAGDKNNPLKEPFTVVISENLAFKLFGNENPIGKIIMHDRGRKYTVTAIVKNIPGNSHLKFDYLLSYQTMYSIRKDIETAWGMVNYSNYVLLKKNVSYKEFENKLPYIVQKYHNPQSSKSRYYLVPVKDLHFTTNMNFTPYESMDIKNIYIVIVVAFLVLFVACINYINLATARGGTRSREVGIRKTVGAYRSQLVKQFLGESFVSVFFSLFISLFLVYVLFPYFKKISANGIELDVLTSWQSISGLLGLLFLVGFISGSYPAFLLSSLKPVNVLKSSFKPKLSGGQLKLQNVLVVFQFCVTIILVVGTIVIQKQMYFIKNKDIGYNKENIVTIRLWDNESRQNTQTIKNELLKYPDIVTASISNTSPVSQTEVNDVKIIDESGQTINLPMVTTYFADYDYIDLFKMKIVKGRNFSADFSGNVDTQAIINETAAKQAGLSDPIGKKIIRVRKEYAIVGVVKDFNFTSLKTKVEPLMLTYVPNRMRMFFIKISGKNMNETLANINSVFRKFSPNFVFDYSFMNDTYMKMYKTEERSGGIALSFSIITIIIAAIGLYGLVSFIVGKKAKEIGVRKVLGASVSSVIWLISKEYFALILISLCISLPAAYYITNEWLNIFVYHTRVNIWLLLSAAFIIILIALSSIAMQAVKAAVANPVESLKSE